MSACIHCQRTDGPRHTKHCTEVRRDAYPHAATPASQLPLARKHLVLSGVHNKTVIQTVRGFIIADFISFLEALILADSYVGALIIIYGSLIMILAGAFFMEAVLNALIHVFHALRSVIARRRNKKIN